MNTTTRVYWLHALTPLHVGAGRGAGLVDLPLMREKATGWPVVPGSTIKGVMRSHFARQADADGESLGGHGRHGLADLLDIAFGRSGDESAAAGGLAYADARLVLLPVRSLYGTFAWVSSPLCLQRLARDLQGGGLPSPPTELRIPVDRVATTPSTVLAVDGKVYLEDLDFAPADGQARATVGAWAEFLGRSLFADEPAWRDLLSERLAVVHGDVFNTLAETDTEVVARVRLSEKTKTVESGALWYEENLPAESVLAGLVWCDQGRGSSGVSPDELLERFCCRPLSCQIGGKTTVGRGLARCLFQGREER